MSDTVVVPDEETTVQDRTAARGPGRGVLALAGVLAGLAGLATSEGVTWALGAEEGPVVAVAVAVRDLTPGSLANTLVHAVGHLDKPLLVGGTTVILLAICGVAGVLGGRRPLLADAIFFVLALLGLLALIGSPHPGLASGLALVVGLITWIVALRALDSALTRPRRSHEASRRGFLVRAAVVVGVAAVALGGGRLASGGRRKVEAARSLLRLPVHGGSQPAGTDLNVPGIASWRTPNSDFYLIGTNLTPPDIAPSEWRLRIHGMVDREVTVTYQDLLDRGLSEAWITLCCVSNEVGGDLIGNAYWSGVPVREFLEQAGVQAGADAVKQTSDDGWTCGTPIQALTDDRNALLAVAMNGRPLPIEHGFPVRMVVPGLYGYVSATKWVVDLEVTRFSDFSAFWTDRGWSEKGPVKTQSRIDVPRRGEQVATGKVAVGGSAWAQHTGIEKVEYQLDGGPWTTATLGAAAGVDTWVQWTGEVDLDSGEHQLVVRATDRSGYTQTSARTDVIPNGASGWHTVGFSAG